MNQLLSLKIRPKNIDEILGQEKLAGPKGIIRRLLEEKIIFSCILYGSPGTGKTSLAWVIVNTLNWPYKFLNATTNNKKDFDEAIEEAKTSDKYLLIVDEIHRMNKDKQDLLLPYIEDGTIVLIGMTTSNPYHKINPAIRSRCHIFTLDELTQEDIQNGLKRIVKNKVLSGCKISSSGIEYITKMSNGDIRFAYNMLECAYTIDHNITLPLLKTVCSHANSAQDANEDGYYDAISALQKSIRGSDADAALHYLARLLDSEDLDIIYRRLTVIAYEDIGLANPGIGPKVDAVINACERLGLPEARIPLGDLVIEMALSPKSNSGHIALDKAIDDIHTKSIGKVPRHLQTNSPDYKYPHDYPGHFVKQQYLPDELVGTHYYEPAQRDQKGLKETYETICKIQDK